MIRMLLFIPFLFLFSCNETIKDKTDISTPSGGDKKEALNKENLFLDWKNSQTSILAEEGYSPKFLPNSDKFIYTDKNYNGLWISALGDKKSTKISDARSAGFQPLLLEDQIIYQKKSKKSSFHLVNLNSLDQQDFDNKSDAIHAALQHQENSQLVMLSPDLNSLIIYKTGQESMKIQPGNFRNCLNPSFSPDEQKILFEVSGIGGFICDLEGIITHKLGSLDKPQWLNNEEVVYTRTEDDGMLTTKVEMYLQNISTNEELQINSGQKQIIENPTVHYSGRKILANTDNGQLILMYK